MIIRRKNHCIYIRFRCLILSGSSFTISKRKRLGLFPVSFQSLHKGSFYSSYKCVYLSLSKLHKESMWFIINGGYVSFITYSWNLVKNKPRHIVTKSYDNTSIFLKVTCLGHSAILRIVSYYSNWEKAIGFLLFVISL